MGSGNAVTGLSRSVLNVQRRFDERTPLDPIYPAVKPSRGDKELWYDLKSGASDTVSDLSHAPPGSDTILMNYHVKLVIYQ